jgi:WD40 repeat protein
VASAVDSGAIEFWDLRRTDCVASRIQAHSRIARCIDWHPEVENLLISGGGDKLIRLWEVSTQKAINKIQTF